MRVLRRHPLIVLCMLTPVVVWLWWSAIPPRNHAPAPDGGLDELSQISTAPILDVEPLDAPWQNPRGTIRALSKLKPGMTRAEVEGMVGTPTAHNTHPVQVVEGRVTYHTSYEADLGPPSTIRPIRPMPKELVPQPRDRTVITLEYDATKPGHPLLGIFYPDPLF